jgi:hypothetical protein
MRPSRKGGPVDPAKERARVQGAAVRRAKAADTVLHSRDIFPGFWLDAFGVGAGEQRGKVTMGVRR